LELVHNRLLFMGQLDLDIVGQMLSMILVMMPQLNCHPFIRLLKDVVLFDLAKNLNWRVQINLDYAVQPVVVPNEVAPAGRLADGVMCVFRHFVWVAKEFK